MQHRALYMKTYLRCIVAGDINLPQKRWIAKINISIYLSGRSQWLRGLRRGSAAVRLLRLWVRILLGGMDVCCECCVLSGRGLCDEPISRTEESYRLWCVVVCDLETSRGHGPRWAAAPQENIYIYIFDSPAWLLETEAIGCTETSVTKYQSTLRKILEERRPQILF